MGTFIPKKKDLPSIFVGLPNMGNLRTELVMNTWNWLSSDYPLEIYPPINVRPIPAARNLITKKFLESGRDFLLMIDADMSIAGNIFDLATLNLDVVGAFAVMMKDDGPMASIMQKTDEGYQVIQEVRANSVVEVAATGTGVIMIARRVLEKLDPPYFEYTLTEEGLLELGQDFYFCEKVKAAGFKIYVHTGIISSHYVTTDLTRVFELKNQLIRTQKQVVCEENIKLEDIPEAPPEVKPITDTTGNAIKDTIDVTHDEPAVSIPASAPLAKTEPKEPGSNSTKAPLKIIKV